MPILALTNTIKILGGNLLPFCEARALFKDRFADPQAKEDARKTWFKTLISKPAATISRSKWHPEETTFVHARLMSRLVINLANGVMENANLNLDRFGLPYIPGSAIKGLARRMALQALRDWIAAGSERPAQDDACAPCCEAFVSPAQMLAAIAHIFGWTPEDWQTEKNDGHYKSDFAWACAGDQALLISAKKLNQSFDTFAGSIAFLEAYPNTDPGLELDVLTPHHTKYYEGKDTKYNNAPDTEDPVPVYFPTVKPQIDGDSFTFPLIPLRLAKPENLHYATTFLSHGLELLGIGAKTHAGYGYFQIMRSGTPLYPQRFQPCLAPADTFLSQWGGKQINSMNVRAFAKLVVNLDGQTILAILDSIAPGKTSDLNDTFWNPFKTDPTGKTVIEKIRTII